MYLDNAATTAIRPIVDQIYQEVARETFYNPSALYGKAIEAGKMVSSARKDLAKLLGVEDNTIVFTSCGSESDTQALLCTRKRPGSRVIVSAVEHPAVFNAAMELKQRGFDVVVAPVDEYGQVKQDELKALLTPDTSLVSIMHVNNVTGAINPVKELVKMVKEYNPSILFHSDGVQAFGHIPVNLRALGVDLYSVSGHKVGAPKGVGALYVKPGVSLSPLIFGGGQENGLRSGTENVLGVLSFAACAKQCVAAIPALNSKGNEMNEKVRAFARNIEGCKVLSPEGGAPHILALTFAKARGETVMHTLEGYDIQVGIGSACSSKKGSARIPKELGLKDGYEMGMIRLSINPYDEYDWDKLIDALKTTNETLSKYLRS